MQNPNVPAELSAAGRWRRETELVGGWVEEVVRISRLSHDRDNELVV